MATRREMLEKLATATGALVLAPAVLGLGCGSESAPQPTPEPTPEPTTGSETPEPIAVPTSRPADWDAIAFNRTRGNAGAIPDSYLESINGPEGELKHLGKHLPFVPELDPALVPPGMLAIMWGDPSKGHAPHPNAPPSEDNPDGHWYNWIRIRVATDGDAEEVETQFSGWPLADQEDSGAYAVQGEGEITDDGGKQTIYLVALPEGVAAGAEIRVYAHCLTHGEYVDFLTLS